MSKELLKQIGENWYGDQWQAPLARELSVGERSMRRWAAGTDEIPEGVWRDILFRLEARRDYAHFYLGEVKSILGQKQKRVAVSPSQSADGFQIQVTTGPRSSQA